MEITNDLVLSVAESYTVLELTSYRKTAMEAILSGLDRVEITGTNHLHGSAQGVFVKGDPGAIVRLCNLALAHKQAEADGAAQAGNRGLTHGDFRGRVVGW